MQRRYEKFYSSVLERDVEILSFGQFGPPMIVFPGDGGRFFDFENNGMIEAVAHLIDAGKLKLYCTDGLGESFKAEQPELQHTIFQDYIVKDLVPTIHMDCQGPVMIGIVGCSLGAFHAANFALKFPHLFHYALCMSGRYDLEAMTGGNG